MILTFRPVKVWPEGWRDPDRARARAVSPFTATYRDTLEILDRELHAIGARDPFLQVDADPRQVRADGQLRADARVDHPGVILTFDTRRHGTLVYACDRYVRPSWRSSSGASWQHNLRAIALGLEALRKVERYGIAERGQQYAGYRELPSGIAVGAAMTVEDAARLLAEHDGRPQAPEEWRDLLPDNGSPEAVRSAFRHASKQHHPDNGGDPEIFRRLVAARDLLLEGAR